MRPSRFSRFGSVQNKDFMYNSRSERIRLSWTLSVRSYKQSFPANQVSISANVNSVNVGALMRDIYYKPRNRTEVKSLLKNILGLLLIVLEKIAG